MLHVMTRTLSTNGHSGHTQGDTTAHRSTPRAAIARRWPAILGVVSALLFFGGEAPGSVDGFAAVLVSMPVAYLLFGWARGELAERRELVVQLDGLVAYSALAVAAVVVGGSAGWYLLAAGWAGHAAWDLWHHRKGRVVPRAWAEWCFVVDIAGAAVFLFAA